MAQDNVIPFYKHYFEQRKRELQEKAMEWQMNGVKVEYHEVLENPRYDRFTTKKEN